MEAQPRGASLHVTVKAWTARATQLDYELLLDKRDSGNRARTRQAGKIALEGGETLALSTIKLDKIPVAHYTFSARLYRAGLLVAEQKQEY